MTTTGRTSQQVFAEGFDDLEVHAARFVAVEQEAEMCDDILIGGRVVVIAASDLVPAAVQQAEVECRDP